MVKYYRTDDKKIYEVSELTQGIWIDMVNPTVSEGEEVAEKLNIDLNNYNNEYTMYQLIGYPNQPDKEYLFRKYIDNPFGVIFLQNLDTNLNNPLLDKLLKNKHLIDSFGNAIDFHNILFVTQTFSTHTSIGFINTPKSNDILSKYFINYQEIVPIK